MVTDLFRDFAYCVLTGAVDAVSTSVAVDELGRLPSNAELAGGEFWMTFESTFAVGQFEIVQLLSKSLPAGAGTVSLTRAQQGTAGYPHASGVFLKHALTAEVMRRLAAPSPYLRYQDLGNFNVVGIAQCFSDPSVLRGVAGGQAGGATVVSGLLIDRGLTVNALGGAATATATITAAAVPSSAAEPVGAQMFGT